MRLTDRDKLILEALCQKIRIATLDQFAKTWWSECKESVSLARKRLSKLAECDFVGRERVIAAKLPVLNTAVAQWQPGEKRPDCGAIAWKLQSSWIHAPKATNVYFAGPAALQIFGGKRGKKLKATFQATHDLGVTQMYLHLVKTQPATSELWVGEDILAADRRKQKLPDAALVDPENTLIKTVLEFGGDYDKRRVIAFHNDCEQRKLPYEIW